MIPSCESHSSNSLSPAIKSRPLSFRGEYAFYTTSGIAVRSRDFGGGERARCVRRGSAADYGDCAGADSRDGYEEVVSVLFENHWAAGGEVGVLHEAERGGEVLQREFAAED